MKVTKESVLETGDVISEEDLKLINGYAKKELSAGEVFTFSVLLCDNEIDRDYECFTTESLNMLSELFVGKTGIFDHEWRAKTQVGRIYKTELVYDKYENTSYGEPYAYLKGYVYMLRTKENESLIAEINGGIKKEVSIGCSVKEKVCSICGEDADGVSCPHTRGREYGGKLCYAMLKSPSDAYEWSFVAVPAQKKAGVIKKFGPETGCQTLKEYVEQSGNRQFEKDFAAMEKLCDTGRRYLKQLYEETVKLGVASDSGFSREFLEKALSGMGEDELSEFKKVFENKINETYPLVFQLHGSEGEKEKFSGEEFLI